ncbi:hypothetical protein GCM10009677_06860 [Sphaerisporangium rubeum]|uniref:Guanylate cyclase domain-containing protein n=1 Tax=Sphaerisporangium rubeum TaxID=321317 RepID=A0A7X0IKK7_9ACTN|nr:hypothetical protein [Sphaerisporangium rubeum]MBB6476881.1 hypothetical protein [Sphaerisporangium rubeum]
MDIDERNPRDLPRHRALFVVDMRDYSSAADPSMEQVRKDIDDLLATAFAQSGLSEEWQSPELRNDTGDGFILGLPTTRMWRLLDPLIENLDRVLYRYDQVRLASTPAVRLRVSVHLGPLPDSYRGSAINDLCRLVSSDQASAALTIAVERRAFVALIISDEVFQVVVRQGRTERLDHRDFHKVIATVPCKNFEALAWVHAPRVGASAFESLSTPTNNDAVAPRDTNATASATVNAAAPKYSIGHIGHFAETSNAPVRIRMDVRGDQ